MMHYLNESNRKKEKIEGSTQQSHITCFSQKTRTQKDTSSQKIIALYAYQKSFYLYSGYHSVNNSKGTGSSTANVQCTKAGQQSLRSSPKASLGEIRSLLPKKNPIDSKRMLEGKKTPL